MAAVLLDTHAWAWSFDDYAALSPAARTAILSSDAVHVSPISFFEIGQKVRLGKWPRMAPYLARLRDILRDQGGLVAPLTPEICLRASVMDGAHRDPFDRILAATAELQEMVLVSRDSAFAAFDHLRVVW